MAGGIAALAVGAALTAGCSTKPATAPVGASAPGGATTKIAVVAAENFWGSIALQLGGTHVTAASIISNPDTDPHSYEATPNDAKLIARARLFIQNGIGYDTSWAPKLVSANPASGRDVLTVGDVVGLKDGDNPHQWYSHDSVDKVIDAITAEYKKLDPADAAYFDTQKQTFETTTLAPYNQLESDIKATYAGTPIGASESIVSPLADTLGLKMATPYSFLKDISEGNDPSVADKTAIDSQIKGKQIKVYVYNSQNSTPDIAAQVAEAKAAGIPVTTVTETLAPAGATFQDWMVAELQGLKSALAQATGH
ncbi:periplasmic solute binding protein [Catenulispora acidiphila DSM 44928]|uniref:Periplasmic solute binding protein n=1 Tax=Catenulispora acidiphila (strain DSM 44928 / JCM 14897 / NBRC 102108 / NRRL B-24433 / ID139908) TaxID=479433 RepID=C7Q696_CATAD|nr:zinc ABC transporter substrate-binding protein [Catenulispora acidiphila]ACU72102.1 periplasmic solute binding protein [Catenulispora acidiphila DSM 44928]